LSKFVVMIGTSIIDPP